MIQIRRQDQHLLEFDIKDDSGVWVTNLQEATLVTFQAKLRKSDPLDRAYIDISMKPVVSDELVHTGDGNAMPAITLSQLPVVAGSLAVTDGVETFSDDGLGVLTGDLGGSGTVVYETGAVSLTFVTPPLADVPVLADYHQGNTSSMELDVPKTGRVRVTLSSSHTDFEPDFYYFALQAEWGSLKREFTKADGVISIFQDVIR